MIYGVSAPNLANLRLNETNTVASVLQNIAVILATPKGTVPMYRDFGIEMDYLDLPLPEAELRMVAPIREAVERWEPRVKVLRVTCERDIVNGKLIPTVEVDISDEQKSGL